MQPLLWFMVLWIAYAASLIVRGFAHLVFAQMYGLKVRTLWFGYRSAIKSWTWGNVTIAITSYPTWVQIGINPTGLPPERWLLRISSGIAWSVNAVIVLVTLPSNFLAETAAGRGPIFLSGPLMGAVFLANLLLCAVGLWSPSHYDAGPEKVDTATEKLYAIADGYSRITIALVERGKPAIAARWIQRSLRLPEFRANIDYVSWVATFISTYGDAATSLALYREILPKFGPPFSDSWRGACDGFASVVIYRECQDSLPEALSVINQAITEFPGSITLYGTRGGVHFDLGNFEDAARDLKRCNEQSSSDLDRGISSVFLAAIAAQAGDHEIAEAYTKTAQELAGDHVLVKRVLANMEPRDKSAPIPA